MLRAGRRARASGALAHVRARPRLSAGHRRYGISRALAPESALLLGRSIRARVVLAPVADRRGLHCETGTRRPESASSVLPCATGPNGAGACFGGKLVPIVLGGEAPCNACRAFRPSFRHWGHARRAVPPASGVRSGPRRVRRVCVRSARVAAAPGMPKNRPLGIRGLAAGRPGWTADPL